MQRAGREETGRTWLKEMESGKSSVQSEAELKTKTPLVATVARYSFRLMYSILAGFGWGKHKWSPGRTCEPKVGLVGGYDIVKCDDRHLKLHLKPVIEALNIKEKDIHFCISLLLWNEGSIVSFLFQISSFSHMHKSYSISSLIFLSQNSLWGDQAAVMALAEFCNLLGTCVPKCVCARACVRACVRG